jgi:hypothetical protein
VVALNSPARSKLFKLKEWLTLPEAARHLSGVCGEEITEADILRLALAKHLTLSVNFVNHAYAKLGKVVHFDDEKLANLLSQGIYPNELDWTVSFLSDEPLLLNLHIDKGKYLKTENMVAVLEGVWNLPMIGGEIIYVENKYHELTGGPLVELIHMDGVFVSGDNGIICTLQDQFDDMYGYGAARSKQFHKLRKLELNKSNNKRKEKLLALRREKLAEFTEKAEAWNKLDRYYPACTFPEDSILVVRTDALREFEQLISDSEVEHNKTTKSNGYKERHAQNREQVLGAAFAVLAKWPDECRDARGEPVASKIANLIEAKANLFWPNTGPPLAVDSIADHLRDWIKKVNNRK